MKKIFLLISIAFFATGCSIAPKALTTNESVEADVTFAVIGDNEGINSIFTSLMGRIAEDGELDFVLHVGDIVNEGGSDELDPVLKHIDSLGLSVPLYVVPGNHDIKEDPERTAFKKSFNELPSAIDFGSVHVILLDNADRKVGFTDNTLSWLEADLKNNQDKTIIIVFHRPFGYPLADTLGDDETYTSEQTNIKFTEILSRYTIAYMFSGHIHSHIEYTFVTKRNDEGRIEKSVPVVVSGGGGQEPQSIFSSLFKEDYHYLKVRVTDGVVSVEKIKL